MAKSSSFSFQMSANRESMWTCAGLFCHKVRFTQWRFLVLQRAKWAEVPALTFLGKVSTEPLFLALIKTITGNYTSNAVFRVKINYTIFARFQNDPKDKTKIDSQVMILDWHLNCKGPQTNMPQNMGAIKDLTSKNIHWVDTLNSAKLIVLVKINFARHQQY